jgi:phosphoribosyl 1,2-cyclic phosphate phosphodiesterase
MLRIGDLDIMPIEVMHGKLPILGYRIGKLAYITDMKTIDDSELPYLEGVEVLVVNALRFDKPHHSHQLVDDAIAFARRVKARRTLLIHMCHDVGLHKEVNRHLPEGVELAYDGEVISV